MKMQSIELVNFLYIAHLPLTVATRLMGHRAVDDRTELDERWVFRLKKKASP